jgi:hypothetical protein
VCVNDHGAVFEAQVRHVGEEFMFMSREFIDLASIVKHLQRNPLYNKQGMGSSIRIREGQGILGGNSGNGPLLTPLHAPFAPQQAFPFTSTNLSSNSDIVIAIQEPKLA